MKKTAFFLLLALQAITLQAQQSVKLNMGLQPNKTYTQTARQTIATSVSYGGGMEPMEQNNETALTTTTVTGALANGQFTVTSRLSAGKDDPTSAVLPNGATITGTAKVGEMPVFTSIEAPGADPQVKEMMMGQMQNLLSQVKLPQKTVKVGESFVDETPLSMPLGPVTLTMKIRTTYKVNRVEGKKAYLDFVQEYIMDSKVEGYDMKGTGDGKGTMAYDMDNNYVTQMDQTANMQMGMEAQGMAITIKTSTNSKADTTIASNK